jgi:membrane-bound serine protease (ClpP class)
LIYYTFGLLALGLILILIEVFIPSMGLIGALAAIAIVTGGFLAYSEDPSGLFVGYVITSGALIPLMIFTAFKVLPKTPFGKALMLSGPSFNTDEAQASEAGLADLLGMTGEALTYLRPAGIALFGDRRVDVVTQGELLEKGKTVTVLMVEGNRVVVEECAPDA